MSRFDLVANEWDKKEMRLMIAASCAEAIKRHLPLSGSMHIMDFGAGTGLLSFEIAKSVETVTAVDTSLKMLEVLEAKNSDELAVQTHCGDIMHLPLENDFDGIVSSMAMHHLEDTKAFFRVLGEHLKPGGFVAICDLAKEDGSFHSHGNDGVYHFGFYEDALRKIVEEAGFDAVNFYPVYTVEKESGSYPVFLLYAIRNR
ncbi:MAG: class I SAM-dependent methyltransferase [Campylobacterota bacterium]|nr:class I SAM-dependent methyltransferase [Campylobacterota bacterium]